ncbi:MAG: phosphoenolpyruvate--protein phosphotransferase [Rhodospirillales bacterium]|nr:phosphoenolpyruvate--protein phosphotransferase [Rhodospirillales bacterium]
MQYGQTVLVLRRLLARIRDVMAANGSAQTRLARIVSIIAKDMATEVCSIYVRRAGDVLELFATQGLRATAVRRTRLRVGEGLIGEIAAKGRPLALSDAQSHPSFAFRPETGEEAYQALMGVPILRGGRVVGVLAVQNVHHRQYTDEEIEALQTVAMVLAELVAGGDLVGREERLPTEGLALSPVRLEGARLNAGIGIGGAVLHKHQFTIRQLVAEDTRVEHERLRKAVAEMHGALDNMLRASAVAGSGEHRDVLETYRLIAEDVGWLRRIGDAINTGLTAEAAVQKVNDDIHARMRQVSDSYLRERVHDLEDLANRLLQHLLKRDDAMPEAPPGEDFVLVARNLGPAQLLDYNRGALKAVVLEEGSPNSHVAIVARALDIPVVGQVRNALARIESGDPLIVDADHSQVFVRPSEDVRQMFRRSIAARAARMARYEESKGLPAVTLDGVRIAVSINAGLLVDLQHVAESDVDGIGLYRTEVPFMVRSELPNVESQRHLYAKVHEYAAGKPVVFRTLDIGGDKVMPYWDHGEDENPAMGWRAIRVSFDRPALLRQQLRALIQASPGRDLHVMFPMIAEVGEFRFAKTLLDRELQRQDACGWAPPRRVHVGAMLEVPALLFQLDDLLKNVDFLSIGTNDLFQFLFASDRGNYRISERYDVLSPVLLHVLRSIIERCRNAGVPVSLCGEMAGRPLDAMALIGIGFDNLSISPPAVGPIKMMIRSLDRRALAGYMDKICQERQGSCREKLKSYAQDHEIVI